MWKDTAFTRLLNIDVPIVQGPFGGGASSIALASIVSNAGGLGSYGAQHLSPSEIGPVVADLKAQTRRPFAINLWIDEEDSAAKRFTRGDFERHVARLQPFYDELGLQTPAFPSQFGQNPAAQIEALLDAAPPVFSFVFGVPDRAILAAARARGIATIGTATTADEAALLEEAGVDAIAATGMEAGGHRVSFLRTSEESLTGGMALIPLVRARVAIPVVAAGGIANGRGIAASLMLGADGVQIGTAFLACAESGASAPHREALWSEKAQKTILTRALTGRLARGMTNHIVDAMAAYADGVAPYPIQRWLTGTLRVAALAQGRTDLLTMWAGQAAPLLRHRKAADLFAALVQETEAAFAWAATRVANS